MIIWTNTMKRPEQFSNLHSFPIAFSMIRTGLYVFFFHIFIFMTRINSRELHWNRMLVYSRNKLKMEDLTMRVTLMMTSPMELRKYRMEFAGTMFVMSLTATNQPP